jgi:hypothetical protein
LEVVVGETDGIFSAKRDACALNEFKKIDRSIPIVSETEKILNRRILPLKSKAQISDGSGARCSSVRKKICAAISTRYHGSKQLSGSDGL